MTLHLTISKLRHILLQLENLDNLGNYLCFFLIFFSHIPPMMKRYLTFFPSSFKWNFDSLIMEENSMHMVPYYILLFLGDPFYTLEFP